VVHGWGGRAARVGRTVMTDFVLIVVTIAVFVVFALILRGSERI